MTGDQLRELFLRFFEGKGHRVFPSSSLIPYEDPTLLLTNAGMVQFKAYFMGELTPPSPRPASCQKCFRTTDIESVGDLQHLTFFEMLGNFSLGDYFKKEAIEYAWEFVIEHLGLPQERLWITIFLDDDESFGYWRELGVPEGRIVRHGEDNNFWGPAGESGPCGPCSEIHYDFGEEFGCGRPNCVPGCDCDRFLELWNLVFTQYYQDKSGQRTLLPKKNVDTGMGLERTAAVVQGKSSLWETDFFAPLLKKASELTGAQYGEDENADRALRIIAEHGRAVAFLIADGVLPSNEGRGYVLRRVLRRAIRFGRLLGLEQPFLAEVAQEAIAQMGRVYPELVQNQNLILNVIALEEERFQQTLSIGSPILEEGIIPMRIKAAQDFDKEKQGLRGTASQAARARTQHGFSERLKIIVYGLLDAFEQKLAQQVAMSTSIPSAARLGSQNLLIRMTKVFDKLKGNLLNATTHNIREVLDTGIEEIERTIHTISGSEVFELYDTYGFPKELTAEIAAENGLSVDLEGFEQEMEQQRERARAAHKFGVAERTLWTHGIMFARIPLTKFVGSKELRCNSNILDLAESKRADVELVWEGQDVEIILDRTPFYAEMGGQVGDIGGIRSPTGKMEVSDVFQVETRYETQTGSVTVHRGRVVEGYVSKGDQVVAAVDVERRLDIARNHTATHLLHAALRQVLGSHVRQMGSLVAPERLRFDFSHHAPVTKEELDRIQQLVNEKIRQDLTVESKTMPFDQAIAEGALAFFGEKYGDTVQVMTIKGADGLEVFSAELCGGTHVSSTGQIGLFQVSSEGSIGAGLRRIEAVTGRGAEGLIQERLSALDAVAHQLRAPLSEVPDRVAELLAQLDLSQRHAARMERELAQRDAEVLLHRVQSVDGIAVLAAEVSASNMEIMRQMGDWLRAKLGSAVIVLGAVWDDKPHFLAMVTPDLVARGLNAAEIAKRVAQVTGGGGGGQSHLGQAGGRDKTKLTEALHLVSKLVEKGL